MQLGLPILKMIRTILGPAGWESRFDFSKEKGGIYLDYTEEVAHLIDQTKKAILNLLNASGKTYPPNILKTSLVQTVPKIEESSGKEEMILTENRLVSLVRPVSTPISPDQNQRQCQCNQNELISGKTQIFVKYNKGCCARITLGTGGHTIGGTKKDCSSSIHMGVSVGHTPWKTILIKEGEGYPVTTIDGTKVGIMIERFNEGPEGDFSLIRFFEGLVVKETFTHIEDNQRVTIQYQASKATLYQLQGAPCCIIYDGISHNSCIQSVATSRGEPYYLIQVKPDQIVPADKGHSGCMLVCFHQKEWLLLGIFKGISKDNFAWFVPINLATENFNSQMNFHLEER
jgi:hypothetical protein